MTVRLAARNLHRFFRRGDEEVLALRDVTFDIADGELVVLLGPSGSGKSTLLSLLAGLDRPTAGEVALDGTVVNHSSADLDRARDRRLVGCALQSGGLVGHLSVADHLTAFAPKAVSREQRRELLERLGIAHRSDALRAELSGGEAARANLALALVGRPAVLVADEPTAHVSSSEEQRLLDLIRDLTGSDVGCALVVSHSPAVADRADRVLQLSAGRLA